MRATYSRIKDEEDTKKGLVIISATYGKVDGGSSIEKLFYLYFLYNTFFALI